jgi:hypothetical protein
MPFHLGEGDDFARRGLATAHPVAGIWVKVGGS